MVQHTQKTLQTNSDLKGLHPVLAGAVGAVVGVTATMMLDTNSRRRLLDIVEQAVQKARQSSEDARNIAAEAISTLESQADKVVNSTLDTAEKGLDKAKATKKKLA